MSRKTKKVIIILGALVVLIGAYFGTTWHGNRQHASVDTSFTPGPRLGNLEWFEVVRVETPGIILERIGEVWEVIYAEGGIPQGLELDQWHVQMMVFHLATMQAERTVEETPEDISVFGLDVPSSWMILTDTAGVTAEIIRGDLTPSRLHYFAMQRGDSAVYTLPTPQGGLMRFTLDSLRQTSLFPHFEMADVTLFRMETPETHIEIISRPEGDVPPHLAFPFAAFFLTSPYSLPWGVDHATLQNLLIPFVSLSIAEFVNDSPASLAPYGLDRATRIYLQTEDRSLDLLIGNEVGGRHYAKLADAPGVFLLDDMRYVVSARPFYLINQFPILIAIDTVDRLTITGGERLITASVQGTGQNMAFYLNDRRVEDRAFRIFYQAVIGLLVDAEYTGPGPQLQNDEEIIIEFLLRSPAGERVSISLIPYNRDFYILKQDGAMEFLISRNQVRRIFETADAAGL